MSERVSTGSGGLDQVLRGGFPRGGLHLLQGPPGSGKTTLALQFLINGRDAGERTVYVTLSQTARDLERIAVSHGWDLSGIEIVELYADSDLTLSDQSIFVTTDLRLDRTREAVEAAIDEHRPERLVYDSLLEVRLLSTDEPRYQRELLGLRSFVAARGITVMLIDTEPEGEVADDTRSRGVVDGVLTMHKELPSFGRARRRIEASKMRGVAVHDGWHDADIRTGNGVIVFPRLTPDDVRDPGFSGELVRSGRERLDAVFGGGMESGTTTMLVGQAGTGKSTIASLYATAALERGEAVALFLFEERLETFFRRSEGLGMRLRPHYESGLLRIYDFNPGDISAGEFGQLVQSEAALEELRVVVIDSFTGYMAALAHETKALFDIQALLKHIARQDVLTILIVAESGIVGGGGSPPLDVSFLGDTVLYLRLREGDGKLKRDLIAVKKRHGPHEMEVREFVIESGNVDVGGVAT